MAINVKSTNWTKASVNSTNWTKASKPSTNWTKASVNSTSYEPAGIFSDYALLLQDGTYFPLLQNGTDKIGLQA